MKSIAHKIKNLVGKIVYYSGILIIVFSACYLLLQIGRHWGQFKGFKEGYDYGVVDAKLELKWQLENEKQNFLFGDVRVYPITKKLEVKR